MDGYPSPRQRIEAECARRGRPAVIDGCVALLRGGTVDTRLIVVLGGPHAEVLLGDEPGESYWFRVWAARGLLWAWDDSNSNDSTSNDSTSNDSTSNDRAADAIAVALRDESWRVREMAAKVVARHAVGDALSVVADLRDDPVPRVRAAATRAVAVLTAQKA
jgi:hypothetical protein